MNRLFELLYLLLEHKQMTAKALAEHFEVSQRTIYRDIDKLSLAGVPVYMTKGKHGGISIMEEFVLNKALLNDTERTEIITSLQAMSSVQMTDGQAVDKLKGLFGKTELDWIEIEFSNWGTSDVLNTYFPMLKQAILTSHVISFVYMSAKGERMRRTVEPVKLCFKGQAWYLYGYCVTRKDYRFFKLLRMEEITVLEEIFVPKYVGKVLREIEEPAKGRNMGEVQTATVLIKAPMAYRAYDELPNIHPQKNGDVICEIPVSNQEWFYHYIVSFGSACVVLKPQEVRQKLENILKNMLEQYQ